MKILIINTFGIGDVLFTLPLIDNIKNNFPDSSLGYIANARTAGILEQHPAIGKVFIYERDEFHKIYKKSKIEFFRRVKDMLQAIKRERYEAVIDLSLSGSTGFLMSVIGIPKRIGFNYKNRNPFLTKKVKLAGYEGRHVIDYYLDLLRALDLKIYSNTISVRLSETDVRWAENFLAQQQIVSNGLLVAIVPGGGASWGKDAGFKRWAGEKFAELADKIIEKFSTSIILLGSNDEQKLCQDIIDAMRHKPVLACGKTNLSQCMALFSQCALVIANDGGPLHMAVAAGTKTLSIFGPVDEKVYGPYPREGHDVVTSSIVCRPCYRQFRKAACDHLSCLHRISVQDVFEKVDLILTQNKS